jgi:hypothetical protein
MQSAVQMIVFSVEELRKRLRAMPDEKLHQFGEAARHMEVESLERALSSNPISVRGF